MGSVCAIMDQVLEFLGKAIRVGDPAESNRILKFVLDRGGETTLRHTITWALANSEASYSDSFMRCPGESPAMQTVSHQPRVIRRRNSNRHNPTQDLPAFVNPHIAGMTLSGNGHTTVPPGFRFHPTDEELLYYYLRKKVSYEMIDLDVIREVDLNKLEPWDLHERCKIGSGPQNEWYLFSHKDKKYPTGTRTNRATTAGFWKATGRDKVIHMNFKRIGMRKTLVFYTGRAPHGQKTEWIMHEYRLEDSENPHENEDGWVVCRVFKKRANHKSHDSDQQEANHKEQCIGLPELDFSPPEEVQYHDQQFNYMCKQELDRVQYAHPHDQFMQLPQLQSPEVTVSNPSSSSIIIKNFIPERLLENISKRSTPSLPIQYMTGQLDGSQIKLTAEEFREERTANDWTVLDRLVASHLNQEEAACKDSSRYNAPQLLVEHGSAVQQLPLIRTNNNMRLYTHDYSGNNCEMDLWHFGK
eukprot:Gb_07132 [translate_table: standard]